MLQDLQLRAFSASQRVTAYNQELLLQYQSQFFAGEKRSSKAAKPVRQRHLQLRLALLPKLRLLPKLVLLHHPQPKLSQQLRRKRGLKL